MDRDWQDFIQGKHAEYKKIGCVECPIFGGEKVYFNKHGFNHLIRKEGVPRPKSQQIRRLNLFEHALSILKNVRKIDTYEERKEEKIPAYFWTFKYRLNSVEIKVIIRQIGDGRKHFFSIMDRS